jgi:hypothetical protein
MAGAEKKKKSLLRRILKWIGFSFVLLLVGLILIPVFFKDEIKQLVIDEANKTLLADLSLGEFDLTFMSTFPNMTIRLNELKLTGRDQFKGVELVNIKEFSAHVGLWSVITGDKVKIDEIHLIEPSFDVRVLKSGSANYEIVKADSVKPPEDQQPSKFELKLQEYSIENATIRYDDQPGNIFAELKNMTHIGKGDLTADVINFETTTSMDEMTFAMDGVSFLKKVKTNLVANILMEFTEKSSKFTLRENEMALNALHFSIDGFYEMLEGHDNMDLKLQADKASFKDFLSLVPTFYQSGYESMLATGNLAFKAVIKGRMDDKNMPGWDFGLNIDKAKIKYPELPGSIDNIVVHAGSSFVGGRDMDRMSLDVSTFHADFVGNTLDATLKLRNPITDPMIGSTILAKVDLATLHKVVPMSEGESYNGKLHADVALDGRMSALEKGDYEAFKATGTALLSDILYQSKEFPSEVSIKSLMLRFSPQNLALEQLDAKMGKSDFQMAGVIDNYMGYVFRDELLHGDFHFNSSNMDLDELMGTAATPSASVENKPASSTAAVTDKTVDSKPILIPNNLDFNLKTSIANLQYSGIAIKNIKGWVRMKEEVAILDHLTMDAMGGSIGLDGRYDTQDHAKPSIDFGYDLKNLDIKQLADNFLAIEKLAPIAKYTQGKITSKFTMKSVLTAGMEPVYSSLSGHGDFLSNQVIISGFKPLEKIAEELKMSKLAKQTITDLKTKFKFENGKVHLTPFDVKLGKISTTISGWSSIENAIDYKLNMNVPKEEIPAAMLKIVEDQVKKVNQLMPKLDLKLIPDIIKVNLNVGGTVTDPRVTTDFKDALLKATGNLKDNLVNTAKQIVKDTVKAIIEDKIKDVKEEVQKKKQEILAEAQMRADQLKAEAKKNANALRSEADNQAKALITEAGSNPIKKKAAELAGDKLKKTADEKAKKLEDTAAEKADDIMKKAHEKADLVK